VTTIATTTTTTSAGALESRITAQNRAARSEEGCIERRMVNPIRVERRRNQKRRTKTDRIAEARHHGRRLAMGLHLSERNRV
jgi:hypothetical protein